MYDNILHKAINDAVVRIENRLSDFMPYIAKPISAWMRTLSGSMQPSDYFENPSSFPMFLIPWWAEKTIKTHRNIELQKSIAYATANGYYYIRLIDNIMDGDTHEDNILLPALNFFHTEFQSAYYKYFPANHMFWDDFNTHWFHSGDCAMQDYVLTELDEEQFRQVAAQKVCAVNIPVAAMYYYHNNADFIPVMSRFIVLFSCWHQMMNDMFDWYKDLTHDNASFFLSKGRHSLQVNETIAMWVVREGFYWGCGLLEKWMSDMKKVAIELHNSDIMDYLETRESMYCKKRDEVMKGMNILKSLIDPAK